MRLTSVRASAGSPNRQGQWTVVRKGRRRRDLAGAENAKRRLVREPRCEPELPGQSQNPRHAGGLSGPELDETRIVEGEPEVEASEDLRDRRCPSRRDFVVAV